MAPDQMKNPPVPKVLVEDYLLQHNFRVFTLFFLKTKPFKTNKKHLVEDKLEINIIKIQLRFYQIILIHNFTYIYKLMNDLERKEQGD
jgi:hypothetical protein